MADTRFKAENGILVTGTGNSYFTHEVFVTANLSVTADLLYVGGNLYVTGNEIISGLTLYDTDILPLSATGKSVGNNTNRFDSFFRNVNINGYLHPSANGIQLGNTARRWDTYSTNISASGTLGVSSDTTLSALLTVTGNTTLNDNLIVNNNVTCDNASIINVTTTGFANVGTSVAVGTSLNVTGNSTLSGNVSSSANVTAKAFITDHAAFYTNTASVTTGTTTVIDRFPKVDSNFAKLFVTVKRSDNTLVHAIELAIIHEGTNILITRYGEIFNTKLGTFDAVINNANVDITFTATVANTYTVKTIRHQVLA